MSILIEVQEHIKVHPYKSRALLTSRDRRIECISIFRVEININLWKESFLNQSVLYRHKGWICRKKKGFLFFSIWSLNYFLTHLWMFKLNYHFKVPFVEHKNGNHVVGDLRTYNFPTVICILCLIKQNKNNNNIIWF